MKKIPRINITLKAAISLDGKIATSTGKSKWITGEISRKKVHELRVENDAILVGINTVLSDDPKLTVRGLIDGESPIRIVLDSKARIPNQSQVFQKDGVPVIIITGSKAPSRIWPKLDDLKIIKAPSEKPEVSWILSELEKLKIKSLLVEGGSLVHASFLKSNYVNQLALFISPKIIGGQESLSWCGDLNIDKIEEAYKFDIGSVTKLGDDLLIFANLNKVVN